VTEPAEEFFKNDNVDSREQQDKDIFGEPRDRERVDVSEEEDAQVEGELKNKDKVKSDEDADLKRRSKLDDDREHETDPDRTRWLLEFDQVSTPFFLFQCKRCSSLTVEPKRHARWHERLRR
jgi:hypothetical protein